MNDPGRHARCGCTDYHLADCPIRTAAYDADYEPDPYPEDRD